MKTIAIFGGTGFVGMELAAKLSTAGWQIRVFSRVPSRCCHLKILPGVQLEQISQFKATELEAKLSGCDVVVNLIGILNEKGHRGKGFEQVHVLHSHEIITAAKAAGVSRYLHMSALGASLSAPSFYLQTKAKAELFALEMHEPNFNVTAFAPSVIFGPNDSFVNRFAGLIKLSPGFMLLPVADSLYAPVYVGDVVQVMCAAISDKTTFGKTLELCGPTVYSLHDLVSYCAQVLGKRCYIIGLNRQLSALLSMVMEYLPGKAFSRDNYRSTLVPSVCQQDLPDSLKIQPKSLESIVPTYLGQANKTHWFDHYRQYAHRERQER